MPSLNVDLYYFEHPKTKRLIGRLGRGAEVIPLKLWAYCGKLHAETGRLAGYSEAEIESIVEWWGKEGECVKALVELRWLERDAEGFVVHDWLEHEGHLMSFSIRGRAAAKARWGVKNGDPVQQVCNKHTPSNAPTNQLTNQPINTPLPPASGGGDGVASVALVVSAPKDEKKPKRERKPREDHKPTPGFLKFWTTWPDHFRKKGKQQCVNKWVGKNWEPITDAICAAVELDKQSHEWTKEKKQFIPFPMSWLNKTPWQSSADDLASDNPYDPNNPYSDPAPMTPEMEEAFFGPEKEEAVCG